MNLENKAIVDLNEYNELVNFKKEVESGKVLCTELRISFGSYIHKRKFYTENEIIENLTKQVNTSLESISNLTERNSKLLSENTKLHKENRSLKSDKLELENNYDELKNKKFLGLFKLNK